MGAILMQCRMPYATNLPRDLAMTTWSVWDATATAEELAEGWPPTIVDFFNEGVGAEQDLASRMSLAIVRNACEIRTFAVPDTPGPMGDPIDIFPFTLDAATGSTWPLPLEVAVCVSFTGETSSQPGVPVASRRGRVYIGPLQSNAIDTSVDGFPNPSSGIMTALAGAASRLAALGGPGDGWWSVFSRTRWAWTPVESGWIDNEFDTQRRRDLDATTRTLWDNTP